MNFIVRFKNPVFWIQIVLTFLTTIMTYAGITAAEITTWAKLWELIVLTFSNPYCLFLVLVSLWNILNDPTTAGITDSKLALTYTEPRKDS